MENENENYMKKKKKLSKEAKLINFIGGIALGILSASYFSFNLFIGGVIGAIFGLIIIYLSK